MWFLFAWTAVAHAGGVVEIEYAPFGRADLAWNESGQQSGTLVAEGDGVLVPPLRTHVGWVKDRWGVFGGVSLARVATYTVASESESSESHAGLRPKAEVRRWFAKPKPGTPLCSIHAGIHSVFPIVNAQEDAANSEEQDVLDEQAGEDSGRIRNLGGSLGFGVQYRWPTGIALGANSSIVYSRSSWTNAKTRTVSSLLRPETTLALSFWF